VGAGQVNLSWTAPEANGSAVSDYVISWSEAGTATTADDGWSAETTSTIDGLTSGRDYEFRVAGGSSITDYVIQRSGAASRGPRSATVSRRRVAA
jgi:hypothetical protein